MTEGRATGIPKILHAMKQNGSPTPEFDFDKDHTYFMCRLPIHPQSKPPVVLPGPAGTNADTDQVTDQVADQVGEEVRRLLLAVQGAMTGRELQDALHLRGRVNFRKKYLTPTLAAGLIAMTVPNKPNSRLQKYRLTPKGVAYLNARGPQA